MVIFATSVSHARITQSIGPVCMCCMYVYIILYIDAAFQIRIVYFVYIFHHNGSRHAHLVTCACIATTMKATSSCITIYNITKTCIQSMHEPIYTSRNCDLGKYKYAYACKLYEYYALYYYSYW